MAEANIDDDLERGATAEVSRAGGARGTGVALADEGADELPALLAIVVGIAILVVGLIWPTLQDNATTTVATDEVAAEAEEPEVAGPAEVDEVDEEPVEAPASPDIPAIQAILDGTLPGVIAAAGDGNTVILVGEVADEGTRQALIDMTMGQPNVEAVDADGLIVVAPVGATVDVEAAQTSIVLEGTVRDEATREAIVARAVAVYSEEQVEDRLEVDPSVQAPAALTLRGGMTDPVLHPQVVAAFAGIDGVEVVDTSGFVLETSDDLEAALNALEPIQFASASAVIQPESVAILDRAAELLSAEPDVALQVGGHTDSLGDADANQVLSDNRAQAVVAALRERGVTNELTPVGFGERQLAVPNDENDPEAQQQNRRIEFRIL